MTGGFFHRLRAIAFGPRVRNYGFTDIMREYAGLPRVVPFPAYMEHGWYLATEPRESDLRQRIPAMLVFNERRAAAWRRLSGVPVAVMGAPFVHYRRAEGIEVRAGAKGTVAFPAHSGTVVEACFDEDGYCADLHALPPEHKPLTVCLHWDDIRRGRAEAFERNKLRVVTAGPRHDPSFAARFYEILSSHQRATSNALGTYVLYSVELGIPFLLHGERAVFRTPAGSEASVLNEDGRALVAGAEALFAEPGPITPAQRDFVAAEAGLDDCLSGLELRRFLYRVMLTRALPGAPARAMRVVGRRLRNAKKLPDPPAQ